MSTPEYAIQEISNTPMQDPQTGTFIPQSRDYLLGGPARDLCDAFLRLCGKAGAEVRDPGLWFSPL